VIDRAGVPGYDTYRELGIPTEFEYGELPPGLKPLDFDTTNFGYRLWFDSKSIGHFFAGQGQGTAGAWMAGFWENKLAGTPYSEKARNDFLRWRNITDRQYEGDDYSRWLDSMTYKDYLEKILKLDPAVTRYADPVLASVVGLAAMSSAPTQHARFPCPAFPSSRGIAHYGTVTGIHSGGNDGFSRCFIKTLIPRPLTAARALLIYTTVACASLLWIERITRCAYGLVLRLFGLRPETVQFRRRTPPSAI